MSRLPAFTLIEVLLSLLLVVLLGTFAVIVLDGNMQNLGDQGRIARHEQEVLWLCQGVRADMDLADMVRVDVDSALALTIKGKDVRYQLDNGLLVRYSEEGERGCPVPVLASSFLVMEEAPSLVHAWTLTIGPWDRPQRLTFRKEYDLRTIARYHSSDEHTDQQGR